MGDVTDARFLTVASAVSGQAGPAGPAACETALAAYRAACAQRRARRLARVQAEFAPGLRAPFCDGRLALRLHRGALRYPGGA